MVLNPDKCHFMILGDDKQMVNLICQDSKIKYSEKEKAIGMTIENKLNFTSHANKLTNISKNYSH